MTRETVTEYAQSPLYYKVLAVKSSASEEILRDLSGGAYPVIARKSDYSKLAKAALDCFRTDVRANDLYNVLTGVATNEYETLFV